MRALHPGDHLPITKQALVLHISRGSV